MLDDDLNFRPNDDLVMGILIVVLIIFIIHINGENEFMKGYSKLDVGGVSVLSNEQLFDSEIDRDDNNIVIPDNTMRLHTNYYSNANI